MKHQVPEGIDRDQFTCLAINSKNKKPRITTGPGYREPGRAKMIYYVVFLMCYLLFKYNTSHIAHTK